MIVDTISSNRIKSVNFDILGSRSTDGEDRDFLNLDYFPIKDFYPVDYLTFDVASHLENITPILENETYYKELIPEEMIEHDIFVKMPPKRRRAVKFKIKCIRRAKPRIVIPEHPYTDI